MPDVTFWEKPVDKNFELMIHMLNNTKVLEARFQIEKELFMVYAVGFSFQVYICNLFFNEMGVFKLLFKFSYFLFLRLSKCADLAS